MAEKAKWSTKKKVGVGIGVLIVLGAIGNMGKKTDAGAASAPEAFSS